MRAAAGTLSKSQKELIQKRKQKLAHRRRDSSSSRGEGPSEPKGKGIDPREWGNANLSQESLDIDVQTAALRSMTHAKHVSKRLNTNRVEATHPLERGNYFELAFWQCLGLSSVSIILIH